MNSVASDAFCNELHSLLFSEQSDTKKRAVFGDLPVSILLGNSAACPCIVIQVGLKHPLVSDGPVSF